jgi:hypothetical protein
VVAPFFAYADIRIDTGDHGIWELSAYMSPLVDMRRVAGSVGARRATLSVDSHGSLGELGGQRFCEAACASKAIVTASPPPSLRRTVRLASWAIAMARAIESPRPMSVAVCAAAGR